MALPWRSRESPRRSHWTWVEIDVAGPGGPVRGEASNPPGRRGIEIFVYGFGLGPGELPVIMNVCKGTTRLRFRGLAEAPVFNGYDVILLPFDTYQAWREGTSEEAFLAKIQERTRLELLKAVAAGATVGFLYEDCFAGQEDAAASGRQALGARFLAERDWQPVPLAGPEDRMEVLVPAFRSHLECFGLAASCFEAGPAPGAVKPICRTPDGKLTGVALREGRGSFVFLPGDPHHRFLKFFSSLGEALGGYRAEHAAPVCHVFSAERPLLRRREEVRRRLSRIERDLDRFRHRRDLLAVAEADLARHLPEWFFSFLKIELRPQGESGLFRIETPAAEDLQLKGLLAAAVHRPADHLFVLGETIEQMAAQPEPVSIPGFLLLLGHEPGAAAPAGGPSGFDLEMEAAAAGIHLLTPRGLFRLLDRCDGNGLSSLALSDPVALLREAVEQPKTGRAPTSGHDPSE